MVNRTNQVKNLDLRERKVGKIHKSDIVTLPKAFTDNYIDAGRTVSMSMTPDGRLILTPVRIKK